MEREVIKLTAPPFTISVGPEWSSAERYSCGSDEPVQIELIAHTEDDLKYLEKEGLMLGCEVLDELPDSGPQHIIRPYREADRLLVVARTANGFKEIGVWAVTIASWLAGSNGEEIVIEDQGIRFGFRAGRARLETMNSQGHSAAWVVDRVVLPSGKANKSSILYGVLVEGAPRILRFGVDDQGLVVEVD